MLETSVRRHLEDARFRLFEEIIRWWRWVSDGSADSMPELASSSSDGGVPVVAEDIEATSSESEIETTLLVFNLVSKNTRNFELRRWHGRSC